MKVVVITQIKENYGAHDWDGQGECPQYWKFKGGNTYVIENVTTEQARSSEFWANAEHHVTSGDEAWQEYVVSSELLDNADPIPCEAWESPIILEKDIFTNGYVAKHVSLNDEYSGMQACIHSSIKRWLQIDGEQKDYSLSYKFMDGTLLPYAEACRYLKQLEVA